MPGAPCSHQNEDLDIAIATYSFRMFLGLGLDDFLVILGCPRTWKTMKFMQLSFKIKVRQNGIGNTSGRPHGRATDPTRKRTYRYRYRYQFRPKAQNTKHKTNLSSNPKPKTQNEFKFQPKTQNTKRIHDPAFYSTKMKNHTTEKSWRNWAIPYRIKSQISS